MRTVRRLLLGLTLTALIVSGLVAAPQSALAASGYRLTAGGARTTTSSTAIKLTTTFTRNGKAVKKATALLQYLKGAHWVTEKEVAIRSGKGAVLVKHGVGDRTYKFRVLGKDSSDPFTVHFVPAIFSVSGSGRGHGVGMSQYGAYQLARNGASATTILEHYYAGARVGPANYNNRTIKVQVLGPPADSRTSTSLSISTGGFTVTDGSSTLATTRAKKPIAIRVSGPKVTARVTLVSGRTQTLSANRLVFRWSSSATVSVAGAQGSYRYGNLQATVIGKRPNVVNEVKMNTEYLYGIDEMPSSWGSAAGKGFEALKAQVIAARSYVINQALRLKTESEPLRANPACDCHIFDDSRSQNYTGWKKAGGAGSADWRRAVDTTIPSSSAVQVLWATATLSGEIAETPYFASSGRYTVGGVTYSGTASNADVFKATAIGYLSHVEDPDSVLAPGNPYVGWKHMLTQAQAAQLFGVGPLRSLTVTERYAGGLAKSITATTATGVTKTITQRAEFWRTGLGLPGAWVSGIAGR